MPTIEVLAWDLDGTLYPADPQLDEAIQSRIYQTIAQAQNIPLVEAERYFHERKRELKSSTKVLHSAGIDGIQFFLNVWQTLPLEQFIHPNPELQPLFDLTQKNKHLRHVMHTNSNTLATVQRKLNCLGLTAETFSPILTSVDMGVQKPDQKAFEILVEAAQVDPAKILYIGDRLEVDLIPAKALGLHTCLVTLAEAPEEHPAIDIRVTSPIEILDQFLNIHPFSST